MATEGTVDRSERIDPDQDPTQRRGEDFVPKGVERKTGLWPTLKRTVQEFQEDNLTDWQLEPRDQPKRPQTV